MSNTIAPITPCNNNYQSSNILKGLMALYCAKCIGSSSRMIVGRHYSNKLYRLKKSLSPAERNVINKVSIKVLEDENLSKAGVKIFNITKDNIDKYKQRLTKGLNKLFLFKCLPAGIKSKWINKQANNYLSGRQAAYSGKSKLIIISRENSILSFFHEAGHAINHNYSTFWNSMQKLRRCKYLALPITLMAVMKNNKTNGEKPNGVFDKFTTFVKNNAGKLAFLTFVPTLSEEAMASFRGNNIAKKLLDPILASKVKQASHYGFYTYLAAAVASGLSAYLAVKLRDKIVK